MASSGMTSAGEFLPELLDTIYPGKLPCFGKYSSNAHVAAQCTIGCLWSSLAWFCQADMESCDMTNR